jgi:multimeric flavodoxin WrbA
MQEIYPVMRECEMLVIASPIYYYSLTGQTHCAIERIYAFERLPKLKKAALLLTAAGLPLQSRLTGTQLSGIWVQRT